MKIFPVKNMQTVVITESSISSVYQNSYLFQRVSRLMKKIFMLLLPKKQFVFQVINWKPYLKGQYRKYAIFIGLKCLTTGFVQSGINITSVTTIMVALIMSKIHYYVSYRHLYAILSCLKRCIAP